MHPFVLIWDANAQVWHLVAENVTKQWVKVEVSAGSSVIQEDGMTLGLLVQNRPELSFSFLQCCCTARTRRPNLYVCAYLCVCVCGCVPLCVCLFLGFDLVRCEEPGVPSYGYKIQDDGHYANTFVLYSCNPGYSLHGSSTLTCLSGDRRVWDKPLPSCIG